MFPKFVVIFVYLQHNLCRAGLFFDRFNAKNCLTTDQEVNSQLQVMLDMVESFLHYLANKHTELEMRRVRLDVAKFLRLEDNQEALIDIDVNDCLGTRIIFRNNILTEPSVSRRGNRGTALTTVHQATNNKFCLEKTPDRIDEIRTMMDEIEDYLSNASKFYKELSVKSVYINLERYVESQEQDTTIQINVNDCTDYVRNNVKVSSKKMKAKRIKKIPTIPTKNVSPPIHFTPTKNLLRFSKNAIRIGKEKVTVKEETVKPAPVTSLLDTWNGRENSDTEMNSQDSTENVKGMKQNEFYVNDRSVEKKKRYSILKMNTEKPNDKIVSAHLNKNKEINHIKIHNSYSNEKIISIPSVKKKDVMYSIDRHVKEKNKNNLDKTPTIVSDEQKEKTKKKVRIMKPERTGDNNMDSVLVTMYYPIEQNTEVYQKLKQIKKETSYSFERNVEHAQKKMKPMKKEHLFSTERNTEETPKKVKVIKKDTSYSFERNAEEKQKKVKQIKKEQYSFERNVEEPKKKIKSVKKETLDSDEENAEETQKKVKHFKKEPVYSFEQNAEDEKIKWKPAKKEENSDERNAPSTHKKVKLIKKEPLDSLEQNAEESQKKFKPVKKEAVVDSDDQNEDEPRKIVKPPKKEVVDSDEVNAEETQKKVKPALKEDFYSDTEPSTEKSKKIKPAKSNTLVSNERSVEQKDNLRQAKSKSPPVEQTTTKRKESNSVEKNFVWSNDDSTSAETKEVTNFVWLNEQNIPEDQKESFLRSYVSTPRQKPYIEKKMKKSPAFFSFSKELRKIKKNVQPSTKDDVSSKETLDYYRAPTEYTGLTIDSGNFSPTIEPFPYLGMRNVVKDEINKKSTPSFQLDDVAYALRGLNVLNREAHPANASVKNTDEIQMEKWENIDLAEDQTVRSRYAQFKKPVTTTTTTEATMRQIILPINNLLEPRSVDMGEQISNKASKAPNIIHIDLESIKNGYFNRNSAPSNGNSNVLFRSNRTQPEVQLILTDGKGNDLLKDVEEKSRRTINPVLIYIVKDKDTEQVLVLNNEKKKKKHDDAV